MKKMEQIPKISSIKGILKRKGDDKLQDQDGNDIPLTYIKDHTLAKHYVAERMFPKGQDLHERLKKFKEEFLDLTDDLYMIRKDAEDISPTSKGGQTFYNFDKSIKITLTNGTKTIYDSDLSAMAEAAFDNWIKKKVEDGADQDLIRVVQKKLKKRDGNYDPRQIADLHQLNIADEDFKEGLRLFEEARETNRTKRYMEIEYRSGREGEYKTLLLDVARI